jgi:murein DD-endopeptidase MepM/ murein hydrolase activator NlpD
MRTLRGRTAARLGAAILLTLAAAVAPARAAASGDPEVAALQVALHRGGWYHGTIDGVRGGSTAAALRAFARAQQADPDAPRVRAFARLAPRPLGARVLAEGAVGADVAQLQFELAWRGFPSGVFDGVFGAHLTGALKRFQRWAGLEADGIAGPATVAAVRAQHRVVPPRLAWPLSARLSGTYGPRGVRFHAGIDLAAPAGEVVHTAAPGRVVWVGVRTGWGLCVIVAHGQGVRTLYAHLSSAAVTLGRRVSAAATVGRVGATGEARGPHLHFEVRVRGAAIDPLTALG